MEKQMGLHNNGSIHYFEGWYYRVKYLEGSLVVIIGKTNDSIFIEVFDHHYVSQYIHYPLEQFCYDDEYFYIGSSYFNENRLCLKEPKIKYQIDLTFSNQLSLSKSFYRPTIMGPFSYFKKMECNHANIFMNAVASGTIAKENDVKIVEGVAYLEKDWGISFPKEYTWFQANDSEDCIFGAVATIPLGILSFQGIILAIKNREEEYIFSTYLGARVIYQDIQDNYCFLEIKQGNRIVSIKLEKQRGCLLPAPKLGVMNEYIEESIDTSIEIMVLIKDKIVYQKEFQYGGFENRNFFK